MAHRSVGSTTCNSIDSEVLIFVPTPVSSAPKGAGTRTVGFDASCPVAKRRCIAEQSATRVDALGNGRLLHAAAADSRIETVPEGQALTVLCGGPYFIMASWLGARDIGRLDAVCLTLLTLNDRQMGPWHMAGICAFIGIELDSGQDFLSFGAGALQQPPGFARTSWRRQFELFHRGSLAFNLPHRAEITAVSRSGEVAYARCRLRTDILAAEARCDSVYMEVDVLANVDKLSLAVVDFECGGCSSVTFSPETGAVLCERKAHEEPQTIEGGYKHLLPAAKPGQGFEGTLGVLFSGGCIAFFRRWASPPEQDGQAVWETTGFCTDLSWAQGPRLSVCLAFRDCGAYRVRISRIGQTPPLVPRLCREEIQADKWIPLFDEDDE